MKIFYQNSLLEGRTEVRNATYNISYGYVLSGENSSRNNLYNSLGQRKILRISL